MVKYILNFRNHNDVACKVEISNEEYTGEPILVRGSLNNAVIIAYDGSDDPFDPIVNSKATINMQNEGQIDVLELQMAGDRDFRVHVYIEESIYWQGFLIPDGIMNSFGATPYALSIRATDGLGLLESMEYDYIAPPYDFLENPEPPPVRVADIINNIFGGLNLNLPLDIYYTVDMPSYSPRQTELVTWGEQRAMRYLYESRDETPVTCMWILENLLKTGGARIYQQNNSWVIEQVLLSDLKPSKTIGLSGYKLISDRPVVSVERGLKGVKVNYDYKQPINVIRNGDFDEVSQQTNLPFYWDFPDTTNPDTKSTFFGYSSRADYALQLGGGDIAVSESSSINAYSMFKQCRISFDWMPVSGLDTDTEGNILKSSLAFGILITLTTEGGRVFNNATQEYDYLPSEIYSLTPFGYFKKGTSGIPFSVGSIVGDGKIIRHGDIVQVNFDKFGDIKIPNPSDIENTETILRGDEPRCSLSIQIYPLTSTVQSFGNMYVHVDKQQDTYEITNTESKYTDISDVDIEIGSTFNSFIDSDLKDTWEATPMTYRKFVFGQYVSIQEAFGYQMLRLRQKPSIVFDGQMRVDENFTYGNIYEITGFDNRKFIPLRVEYNLEEASASVRLFEFRNEEVENLEIKHLSGEDLTEGVPTQSWGNATHGRYFTSGWLAAHCDNPWYYYVVPANKYTSYISQEDANEKALRDIEQNGQWAANNIRICPLPEMIE